MATNRFEQFREGVQQCEARISIESALIDPAKRQQLGEELASRCQAALDERVLYELRGVSQFVRRRSSNASRSPTLPPVAAARWIRAL